MEKAAESIMTTGKSQSKREVTFAETMDPECGEEDGDKRGEDSFKYLKGCIWLTTSYEKWVNQSFQDRGWLPLRKNVLELTGKVPTSEEFSAYHQWAY